MLMNAWRGLWRGESGLRRVPAFFVALARRLWEDRLTQAAGALTYTTLLSLVPLLTIALALSTAFPVFDTLVTNLQNYILDNFLPDTGNVDALTEHIAQFTARTGQLTAIGLCVLGVIAVIMMLTVDETINRIFRVERRRSLLQRVLVYWAVLTLGPVLIGAGVSMTSALVVGSFGLINLDWVGEAVLGWLPFVSTWLALTLLYILVPNRAIPVANAMVGGLLAGIAFELAKRGFAVFISHFPAYTLIYGTFATLLIFLIWLYVSWLVVLAGATLTAMLTEFRIQESTRMRSHP
jgi:membrane protein